jgi:hypothetical protein
VTALRGCGNPLFVNDVAKKRRRDMEKPIPQNEQGFAQQNCIKRWIREGTHA